MDLLLLYRNRLENSLEIETFIYNDVLSGYSESQSVRKLVRDWNNRYCLAVPPVAVSQSVRKLVRDWNIDIARYYVNGEKSQSVRKLVRDWNMADVGMATADMTDRNRLENSLEIETEILAQVGEMYAWIAIG